MNRYFIGFLVAIGLIILLIVLIFSGGGSKAKTPTVQTKTLISYADTDATVRMTIVGPIVAPQNHSELQVTIGENDATYELMQGYDGNVTESQSYSNTEASYDAFLHAINIADFTKGSNAADLVDDSGYCSTGDRYIFELMQNGKDLERYWVTNCNAPKSFLGDANLNITLFEAQIPDFSKLTENSNISTSY